MATLELRVYGLGEVEKWLTAVGKNLEKVPERFSAREDVKRDLEACGRIGLQRFHIEDTGTAMQNVRAESTPQRDGIMVYEAMNSDTQSTYGKAKGQDPYLIFFLTEYAPASFLRPKGIAMGRDFFRLWPALMKTTVEAAFDGEVSRALAE